MPTVLTFDDFKTSSVTCELRYPNAYLIYDHTGSIIRQSQEHFTEFKNLAPSPQVTTWASDEGTFSLEIGVSRFTGGRVNKNWEGFAKQCKSFFDVVTRLLEIEVFTRVGLRYVAKREFKTLDDAKAALASLMLANLDPTRRFNSSESPTEVLFRWEDAEIGAFFRLKAETADIKVVVPPELDGFVTAVDKKAIGLTLDMDYYTTAPVEREQWRAEEWVGQRLRLIRKEANGILEDGGK